MERVAFNSQESLIFGYIVGILPHMSAQGNKGLKFYVSNLQFNNF